MKPILFNTEMVRAILDGRKTSTRRVIKPQPAGAHTLMNISGGKAEFMCGRIGNGYCIDFAESRKLPYLPGDILYVRETYADLHGMGFGNNPVTEKPWNFAYRADVEPGSDSDRARIDYGVKWHPSLYMPRESARIFLRVVRVQAERLQDITEDGARSEGASFDYNPGWEFMNIWNSTVKKSDLGKYGWSANPWVWVIGFERCERPSDSE